MVKVGTKHKDKYVSQWYWDTDWKGNKYKAFYHGPKLDWMNEYKDDTITRKKRQSTNSSTRKIS